MNPCGLASIGLLLLSHHFGFQVFVFSHKYSFMYLHFLTNYIYKIHFLTNIHSCTKIHFLTNFIQVSTAHRMNLPFFVAPDSPIPMNSVLYTVVQKSAWLHIINWIIFLVPPCTVKISGDVLWISLMCASCFKSSDILVFYL